MPESFADKPSQAIHAAECFALSLCDNDCKQAAALLEGVRPETMAVMAFLLESVQGDAVRAAHLARIIRERLLVRAYPAGLDVA